MDSGRGGGGGMSWEIGDDMSEGRSVVSDSLRPRGLYSPWNFAGQNTGVGSLPFSRGSSQPRIKPRSPTLQADSLPAELPRKPVDDTYTIVCKINC